MPPRFVFLHVGKDPNTELMVSSILLTNPDAQIIQCSDGQTEGIRGVSQVFRLGSDVSNLMTYRLESFAKLNLQSPAIYLDTDMLILRAIDVIDFLGDSDAVCCKRTFGLDTVMNTTFKGMDLSEYADKTLGETYPIVACFTITRGSGFWEECLQNLLTLDKKFHYWYGDQEAMRNIAQTKEPRMRYLPESLVACLPEFAHENNSAVALHFKGPHRKAWMKQAFDQLFTSG